MVKNGTKPRSRDVSRGKIMKDGSSNECKKKKKWLYGTHNEWEWHLHQFYTGLPELEFSLTFLQPVISLFLVCHQGSRRSQALLAEHLVALPGGPEEDDRCHQQCAARAANQPPPHSESPAQFLEQFENEKVGQHSNRFVREWRRKTRLMFHLTAKGDLTHDILEGVNRIWLFMDLWGRSINSQILHAEHMRDTEKREAAVYHVMTDNRYIQTQPLLFVTPK